ncbi:MAG: NADH:ubiquinone oxidoreductase subunit NDUFA12 [Alphaproteobacteria bacterium]|nr:MAG: NADH:ubiquinone oxidoreductase subunit NDUFA12 [Alphaproteobacteria bacterium]
MAGLISKLFSSPIFTWWNTATVGTRVFTSRKGVKVGEDSQGNVYYKEKNGRRRWVIYKNGPVEASRVPADWHGWLHYTVDTPPTEKPFVVKSWEKDHVPNLTGTDGAYFPAGSLNAGGKRAATTADYEAWRP